MSTRGVAAAGVTRPCSQGRLRSWPPPRPARARPANERDTVYVSAHQRILHDARHPSHVTLPIIPSNGG